MDDWNVVVTLQEGGFARACALLEVFGSVQKTDYYNVVTLRVDDPHTFPTELKRELASEPVLRLVLARAMPVTKTFLFQQPEEFEQKACQILEGWLERLAGHAFHVRMHRRGFRGRMGSQHEEQVLDRWLIEQLDTRGEPGSIRFDDPDFIIAVETVGQRAGLAIWGRSERDRYDFLKLD